MPVDKRTDSDSGKEKRKKICSSDIKGLKYFRVLRPLLKHLHDVGTKRDRAHNRHLFMDQYCMLVLLWLYSPIVDSLRGLQQASTLKKVQQRFKLPKASLGSLSESVAIFDPEPFKRIARQLADRLPEPTIPKSLQGLEKTLVAVDGSKNARGHSCLPKNARGHSCLPGGEFGLRGGCQCSQPSGGDDR